MRTVDAEQLIRECLRQVAPEARLDTLAPDADLRDTLNLDSLDFLQLIELLSGRGGVRIDEDDYPKLATLASATAFLSASSVS